MHDISSYEIWSSGSAGAEYIQTPIRIQGNGGAGGIRGLARRAGVPGAANGMTVPGGFPNDSFAANLTSGELVVPRDDVTELRSFLSEQRGSGSSVSMTETNELLAQIAAQGGGGGTITVEMDSEVLFEKILDGSRRNERLTA